MSKTNSQWQQEILADFEFTQKQREVFEKIDWTRCPEHIAIIMDGNGRWAKSKMRPRTFGHKAGVDSIYEAVEVCGKLPVNYVTFYAFSTENWSRSETEVRALMELFVASLRKYIDHLVKNDVRIRVIGDLEAMGEKLQKEFEDAAFRTKDCKRLTMTLAMNYSGRTDLTRAVKEISKDVADGKIGAEDVTEELISSRLYTADYPDPELLIRTSGEIRVSNFLLWEIAYSEFVFQDVLWPDFRCQEILEAILEYQERERRFGGA